MVKRLFGVVENFSEKVMAIEKTLNENGKEIIMEDI